MPKPKKLTRKELLVVIARLQDAISAAYAFHANDRDDFGFQQGQRILNAAMNLCFDTLGTEDPIDTSFTLEDLLG